MGGTPTAPLVARSRTESRDLRIDLWAHEWIALWRCIGEWEACVDAEAIAVQVPTDAPWTVRPVLDTAAPDED